MSYDLHGGLVAMGFRYEVQDDGAKLWWCYIEDNPIMFVTNGEELFRCHRDDIDRVPLDEDTFPYRAIKLVSQELGDARYDFNKKRQWHNESLDRFDELMERWTRKWERDQEPRVVTKKQKPRVVTEKQKATYLKEKAKIDRIKAKVRQGKGFPPQSYFDAVKSIDKEFAEST